MPRSTTARPCVNLHHKHPNPWMSNKKQGWIHRRSQTSPHWGFVLNTQGFRLNTLGFCVKYSGFYIKYTGFYVKYSALYFRTEITDSVNTLGMVKDVVKLSKFHNLCIFNAGCIHLFNSSPAFTAPSKLVCLDNLQK